MPVTANEQLMTTKELAEYLRVHPFTVRAWVRQNRLPVIRLGRFDFRFRRADIEAFLSGLQASESRAV